MTSAEHQIGPPAGTPVHAADFTELSTSARLREVQGALAASQADLTRAERERDLATKVAEICGRSADKLSAKWSEERAALKQMSELRAEAVERVRFVAAERDEARTERDLARAELASARQELELLRATHVPHTPEQEPQ